MSEKTLSIEGMSCNHCKMNVERALLAINGVSQAEVSLEKKTAEVTAQETVTNEILTHAVEEAGYTVKGIS